MKKRILILVILLVTSLLLTSCNEKMTNKALQKILEKDEDFSYLISSSAKFIEESELNKTKKAILFSAKTAEGEKTSHYIAVLDTEKDDLAPVSIAYKPLEFLKNEIAENRPESINKSLFGKVCEMLLSNNDYFKSESYCVDFLRNITGSDGIIATSTARDSIKKAAKIDFDNDNAEDFDVIFEDNNANPLYYAVKEAGDIYRWEWLPESQYLSFISSSGASEIEKARDKYGPAYESGSIWAAYDITGEKTGVYKTKDALIASLTGNGEIPDEKTSGILKFATMSDSKPFVYTEEGSLTGINIDIARALAKEMNTELQISTMDTEMAIDGISNGDYHMAIALYTTATAGDNICFSDTYYKDYVIVMNQQNTDKNNDICRALATLKSGGTIDNIISKYNAVETDDNNTQQADENKTEIPSENASGSDSSIPSTISYRVRKSADDYKSQVGAFASLENAKKEANAHKSQGYKVYDMQGNLVYTP